MAPDGHLHANLPFPKSLPSFQRLFPNDAACTTYLESHAMIVGIALGMAVGYAIGRYRKPRS